jgi:hypothetical protein
MGSHKNSLSLSFIARLAARSFDRCDNCVLHSTDACMRPPRIHARDVRRFCYRISKIGILPIFSAHANLTVLGVLVGSAGQ